MDVQSSRKHNREHHRLWLLRHFFDLYRCQLELSQLYFSQGNICILLIYLLLAVSFEDFFPFVSCLKTSLEMLQEWNGCRGLLTRGVRAFQMWLRWSMHIKQKVTARVNSEVKCYDYESSWCWVEQLGTCYKEREILALFELVSSWPLRLVRPELLCAGYHPISSLRCTFRAAKWCQQNDL